MGYCTSYGFWSLIFVIRSTWVLMLRWTFHNTILLWYNIARSLYHAFIVNICLFENMDLSCLQGTFCHVLSLCAGDICLWIDPYTICVTPWYYVSIKTDSSIHRSPTSKRCLLAWETMDDQWTPASWFRIVQLYQLYRTHLFHIKVLWHRITRIYFTLYGLLCD